MTFTYNATGIGSSGISTIRFLIGDTSSGSNNLLTDEEITGALTFYSNNRLAAAVCCEAVAATYSRDADTTHGELSVRASQRADAYSKRARELRSEAYAATPIYVGGRSKDEKVDRSQDSDLVQPMFQKGQDDYFGPYGSTST